MPITQDLIRIENILKNEYLSFLNNALNVTPAVFLEKIKKTTLEASAGEFGARIGIGGGFGMSEEGQPTPNANAPLYRKFQYTTKDAYCDIQISHKTVKLGQNNIGVMTNAVKDAMDASYEAAKWNTARMLFGDGTGLVGTVNGAISSPTTTIVVDDTSKLIEGLVVDIYDSTPSSPKNVFDVQIIGIDHDNKKVTLSTSISSLGDNSTIYVQNSKNREITGLGSIFDSSITSIYGLSKSANPAIVPYKKGSLTTLGSVEITEAVRASERNRNGKIDLLMMGDNAYNKFLKNLIATNQSYTTNNNYRSGFATIKAVYGNREIEVVNERFVPTNKVWGVDTTMFELRQVGWDFATYQSSIFNLRDDTAVYRALLANYMELICKHPGTCIELEVTEG